MQPGKPRFNLPGYPSYFGGKGAPGTVRTIINAMPSHDIYIEPFLGTGRLLRHKHPAPFGSVGFETDPDLVRAWESVRTPDIHIAQADALRGLPQLIAHLRDQGARPERILVYCDPPYLMHTRRSAAMVYHREWCVKDHIAFLMMVASLSCKVMISHLPCPEYSTALEAWHTFTFHNVTRHGRQLEQVWCNFPPSADLHEYTYIGSNFRERERFKRQFAILQRRVATLPPAARIAALALLEAHRPGDDAGE